MRLYQVVFKFPNTDWDSGLVAAPRASRARARAVAEAQALNFVGFDFRNVRSKLVDTSTEHPEGFVPVYDQVYERIGWVSRGGMYEPAGGAPW